MEILEFGQEVPIEEELGGKEENGLPAPRFLSRTSRRRPDAGELLPQRRPGKYYLPKLKYGYLQG